jgi:hypothetical protein
MSWVITGAQKEPAGDPLFFSNVSLLLHGDGTNGSTVIRDSRSRMNTVTAVGNAQISTAVADPFGNSTGVIAFDGTGDYLTVPDNAAFEFGSGAFTIEAWIYFASHSGSKMITGKSNRNEAGGIGSFALIINPDTKLKCLASSTPGIQNAAWQIDLTSTTTLSTSTWHHVVFERNGNTFALYLNGTQEATTTNSLTLVDNAQVLTIGALGYTSGTFVNEFNGYIDDFRITKGVARYTANFTPPTAPFPDI